MDRAMRTNSRIGKGYSVSWQGCVIGFLNAHGRKIFIEYLKKGKSINGEFYANLLHLLNEEIKKNDHF